MPQGGTDEIELWTTDDVDAVCRDTGHLPEQFRHARPPHEVVVDVSSKGSDSTDIELALVRPRAIELLAVPEDEDGARPGFQGKLVWRSANPVTRRQYRVCGLTPILKEAAP